MRSATILYRTGVSRPIEPADAGPLAAAGLDPQWTEWADSGPASVNEALLSLACRGASRIEAVPAHLSAQGELRLGTRRVRLYG